MMFKWIKGGGRGTDEETGGWPWPLREGYRYLLFLFSGGALLYLNALGGPFLFDDNVYIVNHPQIRQGGSLTSYFTQGFCEGASHGCPYYRPLVALSHRLDFLVWGLNPFGFHLTSVLVHLLVLVLFYGVIVVVFRERLTALVASTLFAVHPVHVESVAFVAARTDPPVTFLFLLSWLGFHLSLKRGLWSSYFYVFSLIAFGLSLFTKETGIALPLILLSYDLLWVRPWAGFGNLVRRWPSYLPFAVVALLYLWLRSVAMGYSGVENLYGTGLGERLLNVPVLIRQYLSLMVFPYPLMIFHEVPIVSGLEDPDFFVSLLILTLLAWLLIWMRRNRPGFLFSGFWFLITLFPVLNIIPIPSPSVMERSAYLPSLGFCLGVGFAVSYLANQDLFKEAIWLRRGLFGFLGLTLVIFSIMTIDRNRVWQNEVLIWEDLYSKLSPKFPLGHFNLGLAYHRRGELEKAEVEFRRALLYSPGVGSHHYLGMIYQSQGKMDQAAEEYRQAIKMGSKSPQVFYNLGKILSDRGELDEAINLLLEAIVLNPDYYEVHLQLAKIYIDRMQSEKAIEELREVVRIEPGDDRSHFQLATLLDERGILQEAKRHYDLFLQTAKGDAMTGAMIVRAKKRLEEIQKIKQP